MGNFLTLASGRQIACDAASVGNPLNNYLHIHTNALDFVEAARVFGDPRETETIKFDGPNEVTVFRGYTTLLGVAKDPLIDKPGALLIRLQRPEKEEE